MRNESIDYLRFCGLAMIILAHSEPPPFIQQLRNFDVPLMVLVAGMSFGLSYRLGEPFFSYLWKRVKRLVFPVWLFLSVYFLMLTLFDPTSLELRLKTIVTSYALLSGIDYVWIIRVFILVALVSPLIYRYHLNQASDKKYLATLFVLALLFEALRYVSLPYLDITVLKLISSVTHYVVPYALVFALGLRLADLQGKMLARLCLFFFSVFFLLALALYLEHGAFIPTQAFKYPPSAYYFSYALAVSLLLSQGMTHFDHWVRQIKVKSLVLFIARNSIWVYLWHIPLVKYLDLPFMPKFMVTFSIATLMAYIQVYLVSLGLKKITDPKLQKNLKMVLTG
jgi:hypothetical protein